MELPGWCGAVLQGILLINSLLMEQPPSHHSILRYAVLLSANILVWCQQGKETSPFDTHPNIIHFAVLSWVVYTVAAVRELASRGCYATRVCMDSFGPLTLASLVSLLCPDLMRLTVFAVCTIPWMVVHILNELMMSKRRYSAADLRACLLMDPQDDKDSYP